MIFVICHVINHDMPTDSTVCIEQFSSRKKASKYIKGQRCELEGKDYNDYNDHGEILSHYAHEEIRWCEDESWIVERRYWVREFPDKCVRN